MVICAGGGGIPTMYVPGADRRLAGVEAVIDKDLCSELLARELAPDIVFLDYDMPRLNGIETCRRLRADPITAGATIIMLTAMADGPAQDRARDAGADLFLTKPFSPLRLLRLVDELGDARV